MPEKILIVDDTSANMSGLVDLLKPHGYEVSAAPSGMGALSVAAKLRPDVILLDVMLPTLDGLETCRQLKSKAQTAEVPVLFIAARDDAHSILEGFRAGGADYIARPFQPDEVLARVRAHLRLAALTRELQARNANASQAAPPGASPSLPSDLPLNLEKAEALLMERALAQTDGNVARAARLLGINRSRFYRRFHEKPRTGEAPQ